MPLGGGGRRVPPRGRQGKSARETNPGGFRDRPDGVWRRGVVPSGRRRSGIGPNVSPVPVEWTPAGEYADIRYEVAEGIAKITIDRPEVRNAFRPETLIEISDALERAREDSEVGVIVLTGEGPHAFCSGGDQRVRGDTGYVAGGASVGRFHVTDLHVQIRRLLKPVGAMVAGYGIGGRPRAPPGWRPDDRARQRPLRAGRAEGGLVGRRLRRVDPLVAGGAEESEG